MSFSWILFCAGILWIFLFPLVTISTQELKPRGVYFSENALLVYSTRAKSTEKEMSSYLTKYEKSLENCFHLNNCRNKIEMELQKIGCSTHSYSNGNNKNDIYAVQKGATDGKVFRI